MLRIELSKQADQAITLRCIRADGSITLEKQTKHAGHFVLHDLTHYAVETVLRSRQGFFGLIDEGWDIDDTTGKGKRGSLPSETVEVERIVGLFDSERGSGVLWTAEEFNGFAPRVLSTEEIQGVRALRGTLFQKWFAIGANEKLQLTFDPVGRA